VSTVNRRDCQSGGLEQQTAASKCGEAVLRLSHVRPAQQRLRALRRIPARPDLEPFSQRMEQSKLKLQVEPSQSGPQFKETIREYREIFGM
jgi:hypothetical protein